MASVSIGAWAARTRRQVAPYLFGAVGPVLLTLAIEVPFACANDDPCWKKNADMGAAMLVSYAPIIYGLYRRKTE